MDYVEEKNQYHQLLNALSKKKMNFEFYEEICALFKIYNVLMHSNKREFYDYRTMQLLRDIAHTFEKNIPLEPLLRAYPLAIEQHIHFFLVNKLYLQRKSFRLLKKLFHSKAIHKAAWSLTKWQLLNNLYLYCAGQGTFPIVVRPAAIPDYLAEIKQQPQYSSEIQQMWLELLLEEMNEVKHKEESLLSLTK